MKPLIIAAAIIVAVSTSVAQAKTWTNADFEKSSPTVQKKAYKTTAELLDEVCENIGKAAAQFMTNRLSGVSMSKMMKISDREAVKRMIIEAYDTPRYTTEKVKRRAVQDFRDKMILRCYENNGHI